MGARSRTICSRATVDLLLVSPERFNNADFRDELLGPLSAARGPARDRRGALHQRLGSRLPARLPPDRPRARALPAGVPVLCTTATANDRVVEDIVAAARRRPQGAPRPLDRESLSLSASSMPIAVRAAGLAGSTDPARSPAPASSTASPSQTPHAWPDWLNANGIAAAAYSRRDRSRTSGSRSRSSCKANELKVVVATSALGMGFDKPDLGVRHPLPVAGLADRLLPAGRSRRPRRRPRPGCPAVE